MTSGDLEIRLAAPADAAALEQLERAAFGDPWTHTQITDELAERHALVLVAAKPGTAIAGYAVFRHIAGEAELLRLAVEPVSRRHGLGRRLVEHGLELLAQSGCATCYLEVRTTNLSAIRLYEELDFRRAGIRHRYYSDGTDALLMHRSRGQ